MSAQIRKSRSRALGGCSVARHATTRTHLLNVIIANRLAVVQLLPAKDEALLLWWNALLVLREGIGVNTHACEYNKKEFAGKAIH